MLTLPIGEVEFRIYKTVDGAYVCASDELEINVTARNLADLPKAVSATLHTQLEDALSEADTDYAEY